MKTDEVGRSLHPGGEEGDRQRRGIRAEHRVGVDDVLNLAEHFVLEPDALEHGLDHQIAAGEVRGLDRRRDAGEDGVRLLSRRFTSADGLLEQVRRVALALLRRVDAHVLEHHLEAGLRADIGDPRAHHAGAEDTYLAEGVLR